MHKLRMAVGHICLCRQVENLEEISPFYFMHFSHADTVVYVFVLASPYSNRVVCDTKTTEKHI